MTPLSLAAVLLATSSQSDPSTVAPDRIDAVFAEFDTSDEPGMSVGVYREGEIVYARGFGLASLEHAVPNGPGTVFRIGSVSKQFTAACIALLVLRGELDLDDDVREHVPELWEVEPPVTIRHLVHHTSGVRDYIAIAMLGGGRTRDYITPQDSLDAIARQRATAFEPGTDWQYSNSNYFLLGVIVERASGLTLAEFAREELFEPLGMERTHFQDRATRVVPNRAWGYSPTRGGWLLDITNLDHVGDGSVFTTVEDLAKWDTMFAECPLAEGEALLELLHTTGRLADGEDTRYAFGLAVEEWRGYRTVSHGGGWVGYRADLLRVPELGLTVVCLANRGDVDPRRYTREVTALFLEPRDESPEPDSGVESRKAPEPEPAHHAPETLERLAGEYTSPELLTTYTFTVDGEHLVLERPGRRPARLTATPEPLHFARFDTIYVFTEEGATMTNDTFGAFVLLRRDG